MGKAWPALDLHVPACDPQLQELVLAELDDFQPSAIQEHDDPARLRAFFAAPASRDAAARALRSSFAGHLIIESVDVEDEDWAARSQAELRAVTVGRITIAPPWDTGTPGVPSQHAATVVIRPSMGFGTGHHASTRLVLAALQRVPLDGRRILDVGCGSGVLALAAVRLGAESALGLDIDADAVANAVENLDLNQLSGRVRFEEGDFRTREDAADVVVANLTGPLLVRSASHLAHFVNRGGRLIISGFTENETDAVLTSFRSALGFVSTHQEDEWMCAVFAD